MSQYGQGTKNPPWARSSVGQSGAQVQPMIPAAMPQMANPSLLQYPTVFQTGSMGQQATVNIEGMGQTGVSMQASLNGSQMYGGVGAIQYPTRALNSAAFGGGSGVNVSGHGGGGGGGNVGSGVGGGGGSVSSSSSGNSSQSNNHSMGKNQRVFTGTVTKIQDNFGFVDEDVFFQTSCCVKGSTPQVDDRVLVEAVYNPAMPFKWNATRIQVLNSKDSQNSGSRFSQGYNAVPPPSEGGRLSGPSGSGRNFQQGNDRGGNNRNDRRNRNRPPSKERDDRKRKREETRDRSLEKDRDRVRSPPPKRKSKSPVRRPRPLARYQPPARYAVIVPKFALDNSNFDVIELKKRYTNLYVPSDFFFSNSKWSDSLPLGKPFSLNSPCHFHVMNREVDPVKADEVVLEPSDADYSFVAKVMLLSSPGLDELFSKSGCSDGRGSRSATPEDSESAEDNGGLGQHPSRLIHFLVGTRGQETMAIGGPWSPSLDGEDPVNDPSVLIRTAIRTCKALTAIDLTPCTQWLRFLEVNYYRGESSHKGKLVPARVETVVLFVPDVWSSAPSRLEWDSIAADYKAALERKINPTASGSMDDSTASASELSEEKPDAEIKEGESPDADVEMKREPTHFSLLDAKSMKVQELRDELIARNLPTKGIKSQLVARLSKALKSEAEAEGEATTEDNTGSEVVQSESVTSESQDKDESQPDPKESPAKEQKDEPNTATVSKEKDKDNEKAGSVKMPEKERLVWEKRFKLPETPHIIVHPNKTAKAGRFNCAAISLSSLLGYRIDDTKEHSFEVSLFAEVFNEMLMRDQGFSIYIALMNAAEKVKEDDKDKKKHKDSGKEKENKDKPKEEKSDKEAESIKEEKIEATSDPESDSKKKEEEAKKIVEVKKVKVVDSNLLLACFYFDTSRIGYFLEKDLEDLLFSLGLTISRSQVRKLVQKVAQRDQIYYRKLAEKFVEVKTEEGSGSKKEATELSPDALKEIGLGNKRLLRTHLEDHSVKQESKTLKKNDKVDMETTSGLVKYNGSVVDIEKMMTQLSKSEKNRIEAEKTLMKIKGDFVKAKENCSKTERTVEDLNEQINGLNDKLASAQSTLSTIMANERKYATACREIYDRLGPLVNSEEKKSSVTENVEADEDVKKSH